MGCDGLQAIVATRGELAGKGMPPGKVAEGSLTPLPPPTLHFVPPSVTAPYNSNSASMRMCTEGASSTMSSLHAWAIHA